MKGQQANQQIPNSQLKMSARSAQAPQKTDTIATIAEMAEVSHSRASAMAKHFSSTPKKMTMDEMFNTLKDGFNLNLTTQSTDNWSSLPDVALIEVKGEQGNNYPAVARRNPDGEQFLYTSHLSGPQKVDRQTLAGSHYIALQADDSPAVADFPASPANSVASDINPQAAFQVANIAMIAEIADVSYERAESMASHFSANEDNMTMDELFNTLKDGFNLNVTTDSSDNWSSLPDIALVEIRDARNDNYKAVVRRDPDGEQYIYANHFSAPKKLSDQILTGSSYIGINIEEPANDDFSLPQINSSLYSSRVLSQYPNIAALAEIADVSYDRAEVMASYFTADKSNMTMDQIVTTLNDGFNLNVSRQSASDWSSLPDVALVKISDANNYNDEHLVVVRRGPDNKQYIYDSRLDSPKELSDEQLVSGDCISTQAEKVHKELRVVHNHPDVRNDCAVCAIAVATGDSYENALSASRKNGFVETGFSQDSTLKTVKDLGHSAVLQTSNGFNLTWSELPDLAIISVLDRDVEDTENADHHAVVFQRQEDGEGLIYDSNKYQTTSPSDYKFAKNTYIKIS